MINLTRIIILDDSQRPLVAHDELLEITSGVESSTFSKIPRHIQDAYHIFYSDMRLAFIKFNNQLEKLLKEGSKDFEIHKSGLTPTTVTPNNQFVIEIRDCFLTLYFKSYLLLSKATLDRLVPFFDYQNGSKLKKYTNKGKKINNWLKENYHKNNKDEFISLIENNKQTWIEDFIKLRDGITHFGTDYDFISFYKVFKPGEVIKMDKFEDFNRPVIYINKKPIDAQKYMSDTLDQFKAFSKNFLTLTFET